MTVSGTVMPMGPVHVQCHQTLTVNGRLLLARLTQARLTKLYLNHVQATVLIIWVSRIKLSQEKLA